MSYALYLLGSAGISIANRYDLVQLEEGWTVSRGSDSFRTDALSKTPVGIMNMGDSVTLTSVLPSNTIIPACIEFRSVLSTVEIKLNGVSYYTYGRDIAKKGRMLPKYTHFVRLPDEYYGSTIEIIITAREDNAFSGVSPILFGNYNDIVRTMVQKDRIALVIGAFLTIFGFILVILSPFLFLSKRKDFSIAFEGLLSIFMGIYILTYNDILWFFSDKPHFYTFIEYFSLFSLPMAILGFVLSARQVPARRFLTGFFIINTAFLVVSTSLHALNIVHICHFVPYLHIIAIVEGLIIIPSLIFSFVKNTKSDDTFVQKNYSTYMLLLGLILFMGCSVIDIVKFNILKFGGIGEATARINFMTVGAFIFIICLILNYFFHSIEYIHEVSAQQRLEGLAYTDALTGLANRARCEQMLVNLKDEYTIVSIDLDYLKYTNDNYGHSAGDRLLSGFAQILKESFADAQVIGRMGGDEFLAILPYIDEEKCLKNLKSMQELMSIKSSGDSPMRFSASYGYASSRDEKVQPSPTAQSVYLIADARMYSMKKKHHNESLGRLYDDLLRVVSNMPEGGDSDD